MKIYKTNFYIYDQFVGPLFGDHAEFLNSNRSHVQVNVSDISQPVQLRAEIAGTHLGALSGVVPTCVNSFEGPEVVGIGAAAIPEPQPREVLGEHPALTVNREEGVA